MYFLELSNMKKTIWALYDSRIGSVNTIKGVLQNMPAEDYQVIEKQIEYTCWAKLPNWIKGASLIGLTDESKKNLTEPFPDLVIAASRRTSSVARWIKKKSNTVKTLDPKTFIWTKDGAAYNQKAHAVKYFSAASPSKEPYYAYGRITK